MVNESDLLLFAAVRIQHPKKEVDNSVYRAIYKKLLRI